MSAPKQGDRTNCRQVPGPFCRTDCGPDRHHLLLYRQCIQHGGHISLLDVSMEVGPHVAAASLGYALQAERGRRVLVHSVDPRRGGRARVGWLPDEGGEIR